MTADAITGKLSETARQILERYLWELRISLQGCRSVDPAEVEADVKQHIDQELADQPAPVSGDQLDEVLRKLGSPWQWVPAEELSVQMFAGLPTPTSHGGAPGRDVAQRPTYPHLPPESYSPPALRWPPATSQRSPARRRAAR